MNSARDAIKNLKKKKTKIANARGETRIQTLIKCASTWIEPIETWDRCSTIVDFPSFLMEKSIARNTIFPIAYSLDKLWMIKLWIHYFYSTTHYLPH